MPNNLQILAYIQCMKDRTIENLQFTKKQEDSMKPGQIRSKSIIHKAYFEDLINLEKFIKGGN